MSPARHRKSSIFTYVDLYWRCFQSLMIVLLGLLTWAELWRYFQAGHYPHAFIDAVLCAYMAVWTFYDKAKRESVGSAALGVFAAAMLITAGFVIWVGVNVRVGY